MVVLILILGLASADLVAWLGIILMAQVQDSGNCIANALELPQSCTKPSDL